MYGEIRINTDEVLQTATEVENLNKQLQEELKNSEKIIKNLSNVYEGEAATATISAYEEFANKYFQDYYDVIDQYVKFLRNSVVENYEETETVNKSLADGFK